MRNFPSSTWEVNYGLYCPPISVYNSGRGLYDKVDTLKEKEFPQFMQPPPPLPRGAGKYGKRIDVGIEIVGNQ